jgi:hypothetical protein
MFRQFTRFSFLLLTLFAGSILAQNSQTQPGFGPFRIGTPSSSLPLDCGEDDVQCEGPYNSLWVRVSNSDGDTVDEIHFVYSGFKNDYSPFKSASGSISLAQAIKIHSLAADAKPPNFAIRKEEGAAFIFDYANHIVYSALGSNSDSEVREVDYYSPSDSVFKGSTAPADSAELVKAAYAAPLYGEAKKTGEESAAKPTGSAAPAKAENAALPQFGPFRIGAPSSSLPFKCSSKEVECEGAYKSVWVHVALKDGTIDDFQVIYFGFKGDGDPFLTETGSISLAQAIKIHSLDSKLPKFAAKEEPPAVDIFDEANHLVYVALGTSPDSNVREVDYYSPSDPVFTTATGQVDGAALVNAAKAATPYGADQAGGEAAAAAAESAAPAKPANTATPQDAEKPLAAPAAAPAVSAAPVQAANDDAALDRAAFVKSVDQRVALLNQYGQIALVTMRLAEANKKENEGYSSDTVEKVNAAYGLFQDTEAGLLKFMEDNLDLAEESDLAKLPKAFINEVDDKYGKFADAQLDDLLN